MNNKIIINTLANIDFSATNYDNILYLTKDIEF